ncbi:protein of unknown function [Burkholderia multivorans]
MHVFSISRQLKHAKFSLLTQIKCA